MDKIQLYYVYILTTVRNSVLYTGVTNDLFRRCSEHKEGMNPGFTKRYNVTKLFFCEIFNSVEMAISREKQIKGMSRDKKINLINNFNPGWDELFYNKQLLNPRNK
jgi:putative endonuclease